MIVLIADDERLVRFSIKSMLREFMEDSENIFLEAINGREMVDVCRDKKPDVVLADISMPFMDGLEAISECKKYSPMTQYVIVTGFSEFEYAKKAIHLGVNDYLLKPVDAAKLRTVMEKIEQSMDKRQQDSNSRFQLQMLEAFQHFASLGVAEELTIADKGHKCLTFFLHAKDVFGVENEFLDFQKNMVKEIKSLGEGVVLRKGHYVIAHTSEGAMYIIFEIPEQLQDYVMSRMNKICLMINNRYKCPYYFRWTKCDDLQAVCRESEEADAQTYLFLDRRPGVIYEKEQLKRTDYERDFLIQIEKLLEAWKQADGIACKEIINKIWRKYREDEPEVELKYLSAYCSAAIECPISKDSFKLFFKSFVEHSEQMYCGFGAEESDITEKVKQYVQKNYMYDISISQIAEQFGITANYLSTIFKRKTGEKFIDYLTNIRLEAGKRLLVQNVSASVQDIALMVGYNSSRHFSALFQKYTGETPSSYRKSRM